jgi:hypothetical protein
MSAASTPTPSRSTGASPAARHNYFWPILIYLIGAGILAFYQLQSLEDQLGDVTAAADNMDVQVRMSDYEKGKFFALARDLLRLAPTHPAADKIVTETGIRKLAQSQPDLMSLSQPSGYTNAAPVAAPKPSSASATNSGVPTLIQ